MAENPSEDSPNWGFLTFIGVGGKVNNEWQKKVVVAWLLRTQPPDTQMERLLDQMWKVGFSEGYNTRV